MTSGRTALAILVLLLGTTLWMTTPAGAKPPRPPSLPALTGVVRDVCTGAKVANLSVSAEQPPGAPRVPTRVGVGTFKFVTLPSDGIRLQVSAPGFAPLGDVVSPGVDIALPPGPLSCLRHRKRRPPVTCEDLPCAPAAARGLRAAQSNAGHPLTGTVRSSCNGDKVENLTVSLDQPAGPPDTSVEGEHRKVHVRPDTRRHQPSDGRGAGVRSSRLPRQSRHRHRAAPRLRPSCPRRNRSRSAPRPRSNSAPAPAVCTWAERAVERRLVTDGHRWAVIPNAQRSGDERRDRCADRRDHNH